jgi:beta-barrel assembly-enhancing protease
MNGTTRFAAFTVTVVSIMLLSCNTLRPFLLSESDEITMGNKFSLQISNDTVTYPAYRGNAAVSNYVDSLGQKIASVQKDWTSSSLKFTFNIVKNDSMINAFAVPGGHVYVYTGLLLAAENESQVAGVLAHEIAHITKHHSANILIKQNMVGLINDLLFGSEASSLKAVTELLGGLVFLRFSRDNEYESDSCAVAYTKAAGMNPKGMSQFLGILQKQYGDGPRILEPVETLTSTHPKVSVRISEVDGIIQRSGADTTVSLKSTEYSAIKALIK